MSLETVSPFHNNSLWSTYVPTYKQTRWKAHTAIHQLGRLEVAQPNIYKYMFTYKNVSEGGLLWQGTQRHLSFSGIKYLLSN